MSCVYSVRTREIRDCIKVLYDKGDQKAVDWQPGNGTRYALLFVELRDEIAGFDEANSWQVTWLSRRKTMFISSGSLVHYSYVQEKLSCGMADAICIAEAIGHILGLKSTRSEDFNPDLPVQLVMES
jgi:hypothetical protein